jgi:RNA polymerase sigma factor (sigma-70 family)
VGLGVRHEKNLQIHPKETCAGGVLLPQETADEAGLQAHVDQRADIFELIARAQAGDRAAFGALVESHYDLIYRTAYRWSGKVQDAEDVAQDVCVKLAAALKGFDGRSAFSSWLYRITLNAVRDLQRSRARRGRHVEALALVSAEDAPAEQFDAVVSSQLWSAVRALPEQQRDAVLLVYAEDMSHAAAGEIMGCKEATVSWHIHAAKKTLRGLL